MLLEYRKAKNVTKKRLYIEAMEDVLPGIQKYIIKTDKGSNVLNVLPFDKLPGARRPKMNKSILLIIMLGCTCAMGYKLPFSLSMKQSRPSYCNLAILFSSERDAGMKFKLPMAVSKCYIPSVKTFTRI
jgi:hypothetical protein